MLRVELDVLEATARAQYETGVEHSVVVVAEDDMHRVRRGGLITLQLFELPHLLTRGNQAVVLVVHVERVAAGQPGIGLGRLGMHEVADDDYLIASQTHWRRGQAVRVHTARRPQRLPEGVPLGVHVPDGNKLVHPRLRVTGREWP